MQHILFYVLLCNFFTAVKAAEPTSSRRLTSLLKRICLPMWQKVWIEIYRYIDRYVDSKSPNYGAVCRAAPGFALVFLLLHQTVLPTNHIWQINVKPNNQKAKSWLNWKGREWMPMDTIQTQPNMCHSPKVEDGAESLLVITWLIFLDNFHQLGPLGRVGLVFAMSIWVETDRV